MNTNNIVDTNEIINFYICHIMAKGYVACSIKHTNILTEAAHAQGLSVACGAIDTENDMQIVYKKK